MRATLLTLIAALALTSCAPEPVREVPAESLDERQGIHYEVNSDDPFTGVAVDYYLGGVRLEAKRTFKDGELHGPYEIYHRNGQLARKGAYKDGQEDGPFEKYSATGKLIEKGTYYEDGMSLEFLMDPITDRIIVKDGEIVE